MDRFPFVRKYFRKCMRLMRLRSVGKSDVHRALRTTRFSRERRLTRARNFKSFIRSVHIIVSLVLLFYFILFLFSPLTRDTKEYRSVAFRHFSLFPHPRFFKAKYTSTIQRERERDSFFISFFVLSFTSVVHCRAWSISSTCSIYRLEDIESLFITKSPPLDHFLYLISSRRRLFRYFFVVDRSLEMSQEAASFK